MLPRRSGETQCGPALGPGVAAFLLAACCLGCSGCSASLPLPGLSAAPPRLVVPEGPLDLGKGTAGEELTGSIPLRNAGGQPLHIDRVEAGCACAGHQLSRPDIPPGGQAELRLAAPIRAEGQHLSFPVQIFSNDPAAPVTVCLVKAEGTPPVLRTDPPALDFGEVPIGTCPPRGLQILRGDGQGWPPGDAIAVEPASGQVAVKTLPRHPGALTGPLIVEVRPKPDLPLGRFRDTLTLRLVGSQRTVDVAVEGSIVPPLLVSPTTLYFDDVNERSGPLERKLLLRRSDGKPVRPVVKSSAPPGVRVEELPTAVPPATSAPRRLLVTLDPAAVTQDVSEGKLVLWLQDEPEPVTVGLMIFLGRQRVQTSP